MRKPPAPCVLLAATGMSQAFPFQIGRSMEYSVLRRGGAESAIVTLLPMDTTRDEAGTSWRIRVKDSLVAGVRRSYSTLPVQYDDLVLHIDRDYMTWTRNPCVVPWDMGNFSDNLFPLVKLGESSLSWGGLSLVCAESGRLAPVAARSYTESRVIEQNNACNQPGLACLSYRHSRSYPLTEGIWSDDSGWISFQDGAAGESWRLIRIGGDSKAVPTGRFVSRRWIDVRVGDRWTWKKIRSWRNVSIADTTRGSDSTTLEWTALERSGDSGVVGAWKFRRAFHEGGPAADTVSVDFDSPLSQAEPLGPKDLDWTVFRHGGSPSWFRDDSVRLFRWTNDGSGTGWIQDGYTERRYRFAAPHGVVEMEQTFHADAHNASVIHQTIDSTLTVELVSRNGVPYTGTTEVSRSRRRVGAILSGADLDRFLANGGRILSIRDGSGRSVPSGAADPAAALRSRRGLVFLEAIAPTGGRFAVRLVLP